MNRRTIVAFIASMIIILIAQMIAGICYSRWQRNEIQRLVEDVVREQIRIEQILHSREIGEVEDWIIDTNTNVLFNGEVTPFKDIPNGATMTELNVEKRVISIAFKSQ